MTEITDADIKRFREVIGDMLERYREFIMLNHEEESGTVRYDEGQDINLYTRQEQYEDEMVQFLRDFLQKKKEEAYDKN